MNCIVHNEHSGHTHTHMCIYMYVYTGNKIFTLTFTSLHERVSKWSFVSIEDTKGPFWVDFQCKQTHTCTLLMPIIPSKWFTQGIFGIRVNVETAQPSPKTRSASQYKYKIQFFCLSLLWCLRTIQSKPECRPAPAELTRRPSSIIYFRTSKKETRHD